MFYHGVVQIGRFRIIYVSTSGSQHVMKQKPDKTVELAIWHSRPFMAREQGRFQSGTLRTVKPYGFYKYVVCCCVVVSKVKQLAR